MPMTNKKIFDIEEYVERMPGRRFPDVEREMLDDGFTRGRLIRDRANGNGNLMMTRGSHELSDAIKITFSWEMDHYGIGKPGPVVSAEIIKKGAQYEY